MGDIVSVRDIVGVKLAVSGVVFGVAVRLSGVMAGTGPTGSGCLQLKKSAAESVPSARQYTAIDSLRLLFKVQYGMVQTELVHQTPVWVVQVKISRETCRGVRRVHPALRRALYVARVLAPLAEAERIHRDVHRHRVRGPKRP